VCWHFYTSSELMRMRAPSSHGRLRSESFSRSPAFGFRMGWETTSALHRAAGSQAVRRAASFALEAGYCCSCRLSFGLCMHSAVLMPDNLVSRSRREPSIDSSICRRRRHFVLIRGSIIPSRERPGNCASRFLVAFGAGPRLKVNVRP